jgi:co-chaperonin GroES (HSP10)
MTAATLPALRDDYTLADAFPDIDALVKPVGYRVLVQLRSPRRKRRGLILTDETQTIQLDNEQVAKVIAIGPVAFKDRKTLDPWPEAAAEGGPDALVGRCVRIPKYNGDRWFIERGEDKAHFILVNDHEINGVITGDPLEVRSYV